MNRDNCTPFLLCIPVSELGNTIQALDDFQKKHHHQRFIKPDYLDEDKPPVVNAPDLQELETMETERIMSEPPRQVGRGGY